MSAPVDVAHGTQSASVGTEHQLGGDISEAGVYQLHLDVSNMADGASPDTLEIRAYGKTLAGDTESIINLWTLVGNQTDKIIVTPIYSIVNHLKFTIKQTAGVGRDYKWTLIRLS